ncbi:P-loop NTPase fold protein [Comamonas sp. A7-5]|uniref:KAP family P-loop NTPase fold protein n=1 Tax=Comamonas sp. A7-5 TaxID=673549 RepID=UPI0031DEB094
MNQPTDIVFTNIWARDKLDRRGYADFLYKVIESAKTSEAEDNALIFAIDGEWGTGKSFFIDCWIDDLRAKGHLVSRFDAWKNDIVDEPLIGFLSHIYKDVGDWDKKRLTTLAGEKIKQSQKNILPLAKELMKGAAIKGLGYIFTDEVVKEVSKNVVESSDKVTSDQEKDEQSMSAMLIHRQLKAHNKNLQLIEEFKDKLSSVALSLVSSIDRKQPVFIFIDELDRCRPDYAVRLLEVVKHIFNSKGICFISSVNIHQLQQSIKTIYGGEFEADKYLDRFFSHRLKLPAPSTKEYINSLRVFQKVKGNKARLNAGSGTISREFNEYFVNYFSQICDGYKFDLRTIKTLFSRLEVCRELVSNDKPDFFHDEILFFILCYLKSDKPNKSSISQFILSRDHVKIEKSLYYFYKIEYGRKILTCCNWGNIFKVFDYFYHRISNSKAIFNADGIEFELREALMNELGGENDDLKRVIATLNRYAEVCQMSGRLDS